MSHRIKQISDREFTVEGKKVIKDINGNWIGKGLNQGQCKAARQFIETLDSQTPGDNYTIRLETYQGEPLFIAVEKGIVVPCANSEDTWVGYSVDRDDIRIGCPMMIKDPEGRVVKIPHLVERIF